MTSRQSLHRPWRRSWKRGRVRSWTSPSSSIHSSPSSDGSGSSTGFGAAGGWPPAGGGGSSSSPAPQASGRRVSLRRWQVSSATAATRWPSRARRATGARPCAGCLVTGAATRPTLVVLDDLHAADEDPITAFTESSGVVGGAPALVIGALRDEDAPPSLLTLVERVDWAGDAHRRLGPLDSNGVVGIAALYAGRQVDPVSVGAPTGGDRRRPAAR